MGENGTWHSMIQSDSVGEMKAVKISQILDMSGQRVGLGSDIGVHFKIKRPLTFHSS